MNPTKGPGGIVVEESGTPGSPAILFLHGVGQSGREWREHMEKLSGFHCLAPDLPGHGRSSHLPLPSNERIADLLAELVETRVPAGRAHVVGVSWGAFLVQVLMLRHPDRVERSVSDGLPLVWPRGARPLVLGFVTLSTPFLHTRPVLALYRDTHDAADLRAASRRAFWRVWASSLAHLTAAIEAPCPTLLVAGEREGSVRPSNAALTALMPRAEAWFAPALDHCWQRKDPDLHTRMVEAWCTGQPLPSELRPEPAPSPTAVERVRAVVRRPAAMFVEESGAPGSPAVVFIHGAGQSGREWREHMARLAGFHCLAPDLPGFGRSNHLPAASKERIADLVAELIEARVPAGRASVVGISSAGVVIHALLDRHPDRVERAVIDGSPPYDAPRVGLVTMRLFMTALSPFIRTRPVLALFRDTHDPADLRVASRRAFRRALAECVTTCVTISAPCPTLLVAGEKESRVRPSNAALAALMPHAEAWFAPGLDHCWQRRDPDLHTRMVEAWITGQELPSELRPEPAPSPAAVERLRAMAPETWYLRHRSRIMREAGFAIRHFRKLFVSTYGREVGEALARETKQRFEALLPGVPYIGGDGNPLTGTLYLSATCLAMYRSLRARGVPVEEAARLIYLGASSFYDGFPFRLLLRWQGRGFFDRKHIDQRRLDATVSQRRRYPDDWVFDVVDGDGPGLQWGLDYTECAIVKYLGREGAPELAPFLCWADYPAYAAMGVKLVRTETIAQGGQRCDFRFVRGQPVLVKPPFLAS